LAYAGLDVVNQGFAPQVRHRLLFPENVRFVREANADEREASDRYLAPVWDSAGEPDHVLWTNVVARDADPDGTLQCLWDFVRLAEHTVQQLPDFVLRWGLLEWGPGSELSERESEQCISDWSEAAEETECLLRAFAMTEQGQLVPESVLWKLREGDRREHFPYGPEVAARRLSQWERHVIRNERQREYFESERRAGRGVALQRELIVNILGQVAMPSDRRASEGDPDVPLSLGLSWDDRGRRVEARASGVREIVASHLLSIFGSSQPDVFICSVCGTPFSTTSAQTQRRPRAGVKRLCSEACRLEAKRESNRASWNKNKDRWRPPSSGRGGKGGG
jgi:hypothetical protein